MDLIYNPCPEDDINNDGMKEFLCSHGCAPKDSIGNSLCSIQMAQISCCGDVPQGSMTSLYVAITRLHQFNHHTFIDIHCSLTENLGIIRSKSFPFLYGKLRNKWSSTPLTMSRGGNIHLTVHLL